MILAEGRPLVDMHDLTILTPYLEISGDTVIDGGNLYLPLELARKALGWEIAPDGLHDREEIVLQDAVTEIGVDLALVAGTLDHPIVVDLEERVVSLGVSARERGDHLASCRAPDFRLPDLQGKLHSLSDFAGTKVFLVAYASW